MSEYVSKNEEREEVTLGMAFMGFFMAVTALSGLWFLAVVIMMLIKMFS